MGGCNDRLLEKRTVATVAVARGDSNPVVVTFWVRRGFAQGGGPKAKEERTYSDPTSVGVQILICHKSYCVFLKLLDRGDDNGKA